MKKCNFKGADLLAYCYGELSQQKLKEIKEHLPVCEKCFSKVEGFKKALESVEEQKLKKVPEGILSNYTQEVYTKINKEEKEVLANPLKERGLDLVENLGSIFSSKLVPILVTACVVIFAFVFMQQSKLGSINLIDQEVALLEAIGEDIEGIFLESDEEGIHQAIEDSDEIILAQAMDEVELQDVLDDFELIQELGEEIDLDNLIENLDILDELDIEST